MAYYDDESSTQLGAPVELYDFTAPTTSYRYTSGPASVVYSSNTYTPVSGLSREAVGTASTQSGTALLVRLAVSSGVVQAFGFGSPPRSLRLRVYRQQPNSGTYQTIWDGAVVACRSLGEVAELRSVSQVGARLSTVLPSLSVQRRCQHFLYDARCKVVRASFEVSTTVSSFAANVVTVASVGGNPDGWFGNGGEIERVSDGERRMIYTQVGAVLTLSAPFPTLANGDSVKIWAGCDHQHVVTINSSGVQVASGHCLDKFNNVQNFGGHPTVPGSNPFTLPLRLGVFDRG